MRHSGGVEARHCLAGIGKLPKPRAWPCHVPVDEHQAAGRLHQIPRRSGVVADEFFDVGLDDRFQMASAAARSQRLRDENRLRAARSRPTQRVKCASFSANLATDVLHTWRPTRHGPVLAARQENTTSCKCSKSASTAAVPHSAGTPNGVADAHHAAGDIPFSG